MSRDDDSRKAWDIPNFFPKTWVSAENLSKLDRAILFVFSAAPTKENAAVAILRGLQSSEVVVDGGASIHGSPLRILGFDFEPCSMTVAGLTGKSFVCSEKAKVRFQPSGGGDTGKIKFLLRTF